MKFDRRNTAEAQVKCQCDQTIAGQFTYLHHLTRGVIPLIPETCHAHAVLLLHLSQNAIS